MHSLSTGQPKELTVCVLLYKSEMYYKITMLSFLMPYSSGSETLLYHISGFEINKQTLITIQIMHQENAYLVCGPRLQTRVVKS